MAWTWLIITGTLGFTLALIPQLVRTIRLGRADDVSVTFILLILLASAVTMTYWIQEDRRWYEWGGFAANLVAWGAILWYRLRPRPGSLGHGDGPANGS